MRGPSSRRPSSAPIDPRTARARRERHLGAELAGRDALGRTRTQYLALAKALGRCGAWAEQIAGRRGKRTPVVALARRLAGTGYAIWRDETVYGQRRAMPAALR